MKYKIYTLGCKVNQYDSCMLSRKLSLNGFREASKDTDIIIVNTCAVTKIAIEKCKKIFAIARKENPKSKSLSKKEDSQIPQLKSRYFIKIQDGCEQLCSYCIVPYTRGKLKSRSALEVVEEVEKSVKNGYREIVLSGIHLGLYGAEISSMRLSELIKMLLRVIADSRIRLSSIEISEVNDDIINLLAHDRREGESYLCRHLHLPLQSGSNKILKLMNRPYTKEDFIKKIKKIRKTIGDIALTTDVIVGFPGETDDDFKETYRLLKTLKFSKIHVFPFSAHKLTPASKMKNQIGGDIKKKRAKILRDLSVKQEKEFKNNFRGQILDLVVENNGEDKFLGKSEYYFNVLFSKNQIYGDGKVREKEIIKVKI